MFVCEGFEPGCQGWVGDVKGFATCCLRAHVDAAGPLPRSERVRPLELEWVRERRELSLKGNPHRPRGRETETGRGEASCLSPDLPQEGKVSRRSLRRRGIPRKILHPPRRHNDAPPWSLRASPGALGAKGATGPKCGPTTRVGIIHGYFEHTNHLRTKPFGARINPFDFFPFLAYIKTCFRLNEPIQSTLKSNNLFENYLEIRLHH